MPIVADYSAGLPGAAALKKAGFIGAMRYVGQPGWPKNTNAAELADFLAHGLEMGFVFELSGGDWRGGYDAGVRNAKAGRAHLDALGVGKNVPLYMAIDQDVVTEAEFTLAMQYLDGAASVVDKEWTGPYGEYEVCRRSWDRGYRWQWQCRAWSGTPVQHFANRRLFQYYGSPFTEDGRNAVVGGIEVDTNEVNAANWGQIGADEMSAEDAWNGVAGMIDAAAASVAAGSPDNIARALQMFAWNGLAGALKEGAASVEAGAPDDVAKALRKIVPASSVTLTPEQLSALAERTRAGLLEDLAPLFDLARRLKD